jgi:hypothetical protein
MSDAPSTALPAVPLHRCRGGGNRLSFSRRVFCSRPSFAKRFPRTSQAMGMIPKSGVRFSDNDHAPRKGGGAPTGASIHCPRHTRGRYRLKVLRARMWPNDPASADRWRWREVVSLPNVLMQQARSAKDHAPIKVGVSAQFAVAIAIETFAPVRLRNLIRIGPGQNLIKPGGLNTPYWLVFPNCGTHSLRRTKATLRGSFTPTTDTKVDGWRGSQGSWLCKNSDTREGDRRNVCPNRRYSITSSVRAPVAKALEIAGGQREQQPIAGPVWRSVHTFDRARFASTYRLNSLRLCPSGL